MAVQEQVFGFYIPTVTLMGGGHIKKLATRSKYSVVRDPLFALTKELRTLASRIRLQR